MLQYLYYNTEFVQFQGRYMYPGLIPLGIFVALGLDGWRRLIFGDPTPVPSPTSGRGENPNASSDVLEVNQQGKHSVLRSYAIWFAPAVIALLIPLNLYVVARVLPGLAP